MQDIAHDVDVRHLAGLGRGRAILRRHNASACRAGAPRSPSPTCGMCREDGRSRQHRMFIDVDLPNFRCATIRIPLGRMSRKSVHSYSGDVLFGLKDGRVNRMYASTTFVEYVWASEYIGPIANMCPIAEAAVVSDATDDALDRVWRSLGCTQPADFSCYIALPLRRKPR